MALSYTHPEAPGSGPHYLRISKAGALNRNTGIVTGQVEIYGSEQVRQAYRAANDALLDLHDQISTKDKERRDALANFRDLEPFTKGERDEAFRAAQKVLLADIEVLQHQQAEQTGIYRANRPRLTDDFEIAAGGIPVADTGAVLLADQYTWLIENIYLGATRVD